MPLYSTKELSKIKNISGEKSRTLTLVVTDQCNLRCLYCYEKHNQRSDRYMDFDVAREAISHYLGLNDEFKTVIIDFFGGEPLLAFPLIKKIADWCRDQKWEKKYHFSLSTNGTLLDDEKKNWFASNKDKIIMGLSIDGNRTAHNITRDQSYDLIASHIEFFKKNWPYQPAKMTITGETIPYVAESIIELEEMKFFFTANVAFENFWGTPENKTKLLEIYQTQLDQLVDYYVENKHLYPVSPMLSILPTYLGIPGLNMSEDKECVRYCGAGHEMVIIDTDGKQYPCHRFLPWTSGKETPSLPINRQTSWGPEKCSTCKIVQSCPTCAGFNFEINNDTGIRTTYHCESHKLEVMAAAKIAACRLNSMPLSTLETLPFSTGVSLNDKVSSLLELIENGV